MKILIVDDKEEDRYLLGALLRGSGHEVAAAANGAEALEALKNARFDLIISDVLMPVMDGFELCRRVRGDDSLRHIPFIFYTASHTGPEDEPFAAGIGADRLIQRPCEPEVLLAAIEEVARHRGPDTSPSRDDGSYRSPVFQRDQLASMFDGIQEVVYVSDPRTYEILYVNKHVRDLLGKDPVGGICHLEFQGLDHPCEFCTNEIIVGLRGGVYRWEHHNALLDRYYSITDRLIRWPDGRLVRFEIALDITDRKRVEQALKESEGKYRTLVENSIQAVLVVQDFRIVYANKRCEEITGYTVEELLSLPPEKVVNLVHPEDRALVWGRFRDRLEGKEAPAHYEYRGMSKDGAVRWLEMYASRVEYGGRPAVQAAVVDVTERKAAEERAMRAIEIINSSPAVVFLWKNEEGWPVEFVSDNVTRVFGYPAEELVAGKVRYADIVHPRDLERVRREVAIFSQEEGRMDFVHEPYRIVHRNGKVRWLDDRTRIVRDETGRITHYQGIVMDITDKRRTEEKLRTSEERFRDFFEGAPVYCYIVSPEGLILDINKAALDALGYEKEELVGKQLMAIYPPEHLSTVQENIETWRKTGRLQEVEIQVVTKKGERRTVLLSASAVRNSKGKILYAISVQRDITDRKHLEEQFRQAQKMEAIGRLAGGVAHDFNNLLTVIKGTAQLSLYGLRQSDPLRKNIEEIMAAADRAAAFTTQLLAFSRRQVMEVKAIDINQLVQDLDKMLRRIIGEDIELVTFLQEGIGMVKADPRQIEQAIVNIAVNARDAMPEGGKLTIETANVDLDEEYARLHAGVRPGPYVMFSISDTGAGMSADVKERVFEPFFTTKDRGKGTGLGLSTAYGIVKQSNGHIWVYSEPGKGTTFKVYLPRVDEPVDERKEPSFGEAPRGNETVLVVEDEDAVRELAVRIIEKQGYKVLKAQDGGEALMLCEKYREPIDLILSDVIMPRMSGREVVERLLGIHPEAKTLYMSGYTDNVIIHHGVLDKGTKFIPKPFTVEDLARKVREVLDE